MRGCLAIFFVLARIHLYFSRTVRLTHCCCYSTAINLLSFRHAGEAEACYFVFTLYSITSSNEAQPTTLGCASQRPRARNLGFEAHWQNCGGAIRYRSNFQPNRRRSDGRGRRNTAVFLVEVGARVVARRQLKSNT